MRKPVLIGLVAIALTMILDQWSKAAILDLFADGDPHRHVAVIPGWLDLVLWWNPGVSFGMLGHLKEYAPYILSGLAAIVCALLLVLLLRSAGWLRAFALGLVIGGALGNVIDRLRIGAVVDFLYIYRGDWYWPAFNVADSAICAGVGLLLLTGLADGRKSA